MTGGGEYGPLWAVLSLIGSAGAVAIAWILRGFAGGRELGKIEGRTEARLEQHEDRHDRLEERLVRVEDRQAKEIAEINTKIEGIHKMLLDLISRDKI